MKGYLQMQTRIQNINFMAKVYRMGRDKKPQSRTQMLNEYNTKMKALAKRKEAAIEFDTFMRSNEVQEVMDSLPKNSEVNFFCGYDSDYMDNSLPFFIKYNEKHTDVSDSNSLNHSEVNKLYLVDMNQDGSFDKGGIINWLSGFAKNGSIDNY